MQGPCIHFAGCAAICFAVVGCGGGVDGAPEAAGVVQQAGAPDREVGAVTGTPAAPAAASVLSGSVVKGPVSGADICAYELTPAGKGARLACTVTDAAGGYAFTLDHGGPVILEALGGSYSDEATGTVKVLADPLRAVSALRRGSSTTVAVTPLTSFAYDSVLRFQSLSLDAYRSTTGHVVSVFDIPDVDIVNTLPSVGAGSENEYGLALRTVSNAMANGATLQGLSSNINRVVSVNGLQRSKWCVAGADGHLKDWSLLLEGGIQNDPATARTSTTIDVGRPSDAWRAELQASAYAGCAVETNTVERVVLRCPANVTRFVGNPPFELTSPNSYGDVYIHSGTAAAAYSTPASPQPSDFRVAGNTVRITGGPMLVAYNKKVNILAAGGNVDLGGSGITMAIAPSIQAAHQISGGVARACAVDATGAPVAGSQ
jgi:hypothetical protein